MVQHVEFDLSVDMSGIDTDFLFRRIYVVRTLIPTGFEPYFRERARYASAHTSARVEGNPLGDDEALLVLSGEAAPVRPEEREVTNLQEAYELMGQLAADATVRIDHGLLRTMNSVILKDLPAEESRHRGRYRSGPSLIVDADSREIRYRPPPPAWVPDLMDQLVAHIQRWSAEATYPPPIIAALAHFGLVSVHPFEDGNGRTARLVADMILHQTGWSGESMLSVNQVIWRHRDGYYRALRETQGVDFQSTVDVTPFARFHTDALITAATLLEERAVLFKQRLDAWQAVFSTHLTERQALGLMYMMDVRPLSSSMYARLIGASASSAYADLTHMVACGAAVRTGKGRNTRYALHPDLHEKLQLASGQAVGAEDQAV